VSATRIPVGGERPYEVVVGTGVLGELPALVGKHATLTLTLVVDPASGVLRQADMFP